MLFDKNVGLAAWPPTRMRPEPVSQVCEINSLLSRAFLNVIPREGEERGRGPSAGAAKGVSVAQALPEPGHSEYGLSSGCAVLPLSASRPRPSAPSVCGVLGSNPDQPWTWPGA